MNKIYEKVGKIKSTCAVPRAMLSMYKASCKKYASQPLKISGYDIYVKFVLLPVSGVLKSPTTSVSSVFFYPVMCKCGGGNYLYSMYDCYIYINK